MNGSSLCARPHSSLHRSPLQSVLCLPVGRLLRRVLRSRVVARLRGAPRVTHARARTRASRGLTVRRPTRREAEVRARPARDAIARRGAVSGATLKLPARGARSSADGFFFRPSRPPSGSGPNDALDVPRLAPTARTRADPAARVARGRPGSRAPPPPSSRPSGLGFLFPHVETTHQPGPFAVRSPLSFPIVRYPPPPPLTPLAPPSHATAAFALPSPSHHPPLARETG